MSDAGGTRLVFVQDASDDELLAELGRRRHRFAPNDVSGAPAQAGAVVCTWLRSYLGKHGVLGPLGVEVAEYVESFWDSLDAAVERGEIDSPPAEET